MEELAEACQQGDSVRVREILASMPSIEAAQNLVDYRSARAAAMNPEIGRALCQGFSPRHIYRLINLLVRQRDLEAVESILGPNTFLS